jgi:hypothetical protein
VARNDGSAYDAAYREAHAIVEGVVASILEGIKASEVDKNTLFNRIHEECNNALIYTSDQWVCAYGLTDEEDAIEEGVCEPKNFGEALAAQAYCNLRSAVCAYSETFEEAMAVAEDTAEERGEVTP